MMDGKMTRRGILVAGGAAALIAAHRGSFAQTEKPVTDLKPGEWSWYPERALSGPVAVLVSLSDQLAFVYGTASASGCRRCRPDARVTRRPPASSRC
jgi:hypothetical protein